MFFIRQTSLFLLSLAGVMAANPPGNFTATPANCSSVALRWTTAPGSGGNAPSQYQIFRDSTGNQIATVAASSLTYTDPDAGPSSTHNYAIRTKAANGSLSDFAWSGYATTPACPVAVGPPGKAVLGISGSDNYVTWPGSPGVKYQVELSSDFGLTWQPVDAPTTSLSVTNIRIGSALVYRVAWFTNTAEYRNNYALFSSDLTAPAAISTYSATDLSGGRVRLDWSATSDTQSGLKGYLLYRNNKFLAFTPNGVTTYTDGTAEAASSTYDIAAVDRAGNTTAKVRPSRTACSYSLAPSSSSFGTAGGSGSFIVYTSAACSRTATPSAGWITITGGGSGSGNGTVSFSVAANTGAARSGTITISGAGASQTYAIYQDGAAACSYSLTPTTVYFSSATAIGSSIVNSGSGCSWTATALDGWINITSGASGTGSGTVGYSVSSQPSLTQDRVGLIRVVGGSTTLYLTINQDRNYAPVANAGANSAGTVGQSVTMNGSASTDEDGTIVGYAWNYGDGTTGSGVSAPHAYAAAGNYTVTLTVTDNLGATAVSSKLVTVSLPTGTPGELQFVRTVSSPSGMHVYSKGVAGDRSGNSVSVGYFTGSADFGAGTVTSAGSTDAFVAKYGAQGQLLWARTMGSSLDQTAYGVGVDSGDNIYVTGYFYGTVDFGGSSLTSVGGADIYLAKYSSTGSLQWVRRFGGGTTDMGYGVAVDANNNAVVLGYFQATGDFGSYSLTSANGSIDIALVKVSSTGNVTWAKRYGGNHVEYPNSIAVDASGDVAITGQASVGGTTTDLGGGTVTGSGIFLAKYSGATGNHVWSKLLGGTAGFGVACDPATGNVIMTGTFQGSVNFGGGSVAAGPGGGQTLFLAGYSPSGGFLWVNTWGGAVSTSYDQGMAVKVDGSGRLALTGSITSPMDFGGGMLFGGAYFIANFSVTGNAAPVYRWAKRSTGFGAATGFACGFDSTGNVLTSGVFNSTVDFGGLPVTAYGANNAFLCRYAP